MRFLCAVFEGEITSDVSATVAGRKLQIPGCKSRFALGFCKNIKKRTETLYQSFSPYLANDPKCDTNESPLALGGFTLCQGVHSRR